MQHFHRITLILVALPVEFGAHNQSSLRAIQWPPSRGDNRNGRRHADSVLVGLRSRSTSWGDAPRKRLKCILHNSRAEAVERGLGANDRQRFCWRGLLKPQLTNAREVRRPVCVGLCLVCDRQLARSRTPGGRWLVSRTRQRGIGGVFLLSRHVCDTECSRIAIHIAVLVQSELPFSSLLYSVISIRLYVEV